MTNNSPSILIVDDNPFNREMLGDILKTNGCNVDKANNGKEALDHISAKTYAIIIMDMLMPGLDGFETTKQIRKMGLKTPVIAHTSMSMKKDRRRCMEAGCDEFLPKPINTNDLLALIKKYAKPDNQPEVQSNASQNKLQHPDDPSFNDLKVLLIEEDQSIRMQYIKVLQSMGFTVTFVPNGNEALNKLEKNPKQFDLIISNMFTSGIDGLGVLNTTKREYPHILVFIYAAKFDPETLQLMLQLGADGIIPQSDFDNSIGKIVHTALSQATHSRTNQAQTAFQVRQSQARLTQYGCSKPCQFIDMAFSTLHDAGGDMAQCRYFNRNGRCGVVLADVSGHDILSSYISAVFLGILSSVWNAHQDPLSLLQIINKELLKMEEVNYHVCTTVLLWDQKQSHLEIATAGNPGVLLLTQKDDQLSFEQFNGGGICLGLLDRDDLYTFQKVDLEQNSRLFLFSDGMSGSKIQSTINQNKQMFLSEVTSKRELCRRLLDAYMDSWSQDDDMILLSLESTKTKANDSIHYSFYSDYKEVDIVCKWISDQIIANMPDLDMDMMMLSIREALLNAVEHGNNYDANALVEVILEFQSSGLQIDITDQGTGFNLNEKLIDSKNESGFQIGKRGLKIIHAFADKIEMHGGTMRLFFNLG
jgi:CheY-like chemotaxis protein/anti-sigma regulatory factor (Ser/Thr protein kinase)